MALGDAVAVTADQRAKIRAVGQITAQRVIAQHHVAVGPVFVRHQQRLHNPAIRHDARRHPIGIPQRVDLHRRPSKVLPNGSGVIWEMFRVVAQPLNNTTVRPKVSKTTFVLRIVFMVDSSGSMTVAVS